MRLRSTLLLTLGLLLMACTDTTGVVPTSTKGPHPKSNSGATISLVVYSDLQCPACRAAHKLLVQPILASYGKDIRFEFRQFPLTMIHPYAAAAAEASECAADQGKFWEFVDLAYEEQDQLNTAQLSVWGKQLGLNMDLFDRCRASRLKRTVVQRDYGEGEKLKIGGTPTFFVNGERVANTLDDMTAAIEQAKKKLKAF